MGGSRRDARAPNFTAGSVVPRPAHSPVRVQHIYRGDCVYSTCVSALTEVYDSMAGPGGSGRNYWGDREMRK